MWIRLQPVARVKFQDQQFVLKEGEWMRMGAGPSFS